MLTKLHLKNFRGFKETTVGPLKRVNLIVGQNNTGKTGLLEALALVLADPLQNAANVLQRFRSAGGDWNENFWKWIFNNKNTRTTVEIRANLMGNKEFGVWLRTDSSVPHE